MEEGRLSSGSSRLQVLMFTDLVNSVGIRMALGTARYAELLARQDRIVKQVMAELQRGRVMQDTGNGYLIAFDTVVDAVDAALRYQFRMRIEAWPHPVSARVGLNIADTVVQSEFAGRPKLVGMAMDVTARLTSLAESGQILLTRAVFDQARQLVDKHPLIGGMQPSLRWLAHGPYLFKGAEEPIEIFEVGAEGVATLAPPPITEKVTRYVRPGEEETLGWRPAANQSVPSAPNWVLHEKLGEGGLGEVWLARHAKIQSARVFKFCFDADRLRALKREAMHFRLIEQGLGDRRDIDCVINWQFDESPYFIEMDYAPEGNLAQWAEARGGIERVPIADRVQIVARVAAALGAAHSIGILHKDIEPSNVLMARDADGNVYPRLTDFGIGILAERDQLERFNISTTGFSASNLTVNDSSRIGTRMYAPPEALLNRPHTVQGDVYALGVMLYQMAVGDLRARLSPGWEQHVDDALLREDIAACVAGDPERRLQWASALADRLNSLEARRRTAQTEATQRSQWLAPLKAVGRVLHAGGDVFLVSASGTRNALYGIVELCSEWFRNARRHKTSIKVASKTIELEGTRLSPEAAQVVADSIRQTMGQAAVQEVRRYPNVSFPATCRIGVPSDLFVQFTTAPRADTRVTGQLNIAMPGDSSGREVYVWVWSQSFLVETPNPRLMWVSREGDSEELCFRLTPIEPGACLIQIEVFADAGRVAYFTVETTVENAPETEARNHVDPVAC